jgi:hypothetical protein
MNSLYMAAIVCSIAFGGCSVGPAIPKGTKTIQSRGSEALTNEGDPLVDAGANARKVPVEFAKGYTKGISDQIKRTYWEQQEAQRSKQAETEGRVRYFNATIPERQDLNGVIRVQREVIIPIVE